MRHTAYPHVTHSKERVAKMAYRSTVVNPDALGYHLPMEHDPTLKSPLAECREAITNAPAGVQQEFARTTNTWLDCFVSRLFVVTTYFGMRSVEQTLGSERYRAASQQLLDLSERVRELQVLYPEKDTIPPSEIQSELFARLDLFAS